MAQVSPAVAAAPPFSAGPDWRGVVLLFRWHCYCGGGESELQTAATDTGTARFLAKGPGHAQL